MFALCEYVVVYSNIAFHLWNDWFDLGHLSILVGSTAGMVNAAANNDMKQV